MAEAYLVDTSVAVRWFIEQQGFEHALSLREDFLNGAVELETVDCVRFELGHVLRKKGLLLDRLTVEEYVAAARSLDDLGLVVHITDADAVERAAALAASRNLRFFDAVIADRALQQGLPLVTTDRKLVHATVGLLRVEMLRGAGARGPMG